MTLRCSNCGFDNQDNAQTCLKCSTRLTPNNQVSDTPKIERKDFGGTIQGRQPEGRNESPVFGDGSESLEVFREATNNEILPETTITCPSPDCGFVNLGDRTTCIKCHQPLIHQDMLPVKETGIEKVEEKKETGGNGTFSGTIDPYRIRKSEERNCFLGIVPTAREEQDILSELGPLGRRNYPGLLANRKFSCIEEEKINLNRENLDPSNNTISSHTQAELSFEEGKWYLVDKSAHKTTFLLVAEKTELKDGDVILMGDRRIIFRENDDLYRAITD